jgi:hypothetical protein
LDRIPVTNKENITNYQKLSCPGPKPMNLHPGSLGRTRGILRDDSLGNGRLSITCVTRADVNFGRGEKPDASVKKPMTKTTKRPRAGGLLEIPRKTSLFSEALTSITAYYMLDKGAKGLMLIGWIQQQH